MNGCWYWSSTRSRRKKNSTTLCTTRCTVERCIGVVKRRRHCLHDELRVAPPKACKIVSACLVLHIRATHLNHPVPEDLQPSDSEPDSPTAEMSCQTSQPSAENAAAKLTGQPHSAVLQLETTHCCHHHCQHWLHCLFMPHVLRAFTYLLFYPFRALTLLVTWLELCTIYSCSSPVVTITSIILCFNKHRLTRVHLENGH